MTGYVVSGRLSGSGVRCAVVGAGAAHAESRPPRAVSAVNIVHPVPPGASDGSDAFRTAPSDAGSESRGARTAFGTSGYGRTGFATAGAYAHTLGTIVRIAGIDLAAVHLAAAAQGQHR
ncbi:hypothetical protein [Nocardia sp. NPDC003963]